MGQCMTSPLRVPGTGRSGLAMRMKLCWLAALLAVCGDLVLAEPVGNSCEYRMVVYVDELLLPSTGTKSLT